MAEGARLESVYAVTRIEGSNPSLSANLLYKTVCYIDIIFIPNILPISNS